MLTNNLLIGILVGSLVIPVLSYASQSDCEIGAVSLHCAYASGWESNNLMDGRYIKTAQKNWTFTECTNYTFTNEILQEDASHFLNKNSIQYFICNDVQGSDCVPLGQDNFTVTLHGSDYTIDPKYYAVDFSKVNINNFASCDPSP
jgi:hypothetical protein